MYEIKKTPWGYRLKFEGFIHQDEMANWVKDTEKNLSSESRGTFNVFVDMRQLKPLPDAAQQEMQKGQKLYKGKGMQRSVVVVDSATTKLQFQRIAKQTGIYQWERYIDSSSNPNWEKVALDWINSGVDPDK